MVFFNINNIWVILPNQKSKIKSDNPKKLNLINYKKIQPNQKIDISIKDPNGILGLGWSHSSYGRQVNNIGVWSEGYKSSLIFESNDFNKLNYMSITVSKVLVEKGKTLLVNIYLNNEHIDTLNLKDIKNQEIVINFNTKRFKQGINLIDFKIANPITPISKLESVDGRLLGFLIKDIKFR